MANKIIPKRSSVVGKVPSTSDLDVGEIAINLADKKLYTKDAGGTVVQISGGGGGGTTDNALTINSSGSGGASPQTFDGSSAVTISYNTVGAAPSSHVGSGGTAHAAATTSVDGFMSAADKTKLDGIASGATANTGTVTSVSGTGSYGGLSLTGTVTSSGSLTFGGTPTGTWPISVTGNSGTVTDGFYTTSSFNLGTTSIAVNRASAAQSLTGVSIDGNAGTATTLQTGRTIGMTGDVTWTSESFNGSANVTGTATLATVNSNVGTFGSSSLIPVVTVNGKGLVTGVTTASVPSQVYPAAGIAVSTGTAWGSSKTSPSGEIVGTTDTQTLTSKTLGNYTETVFTITDGAAFEINPNNGPIQLITLGASRTPKATTFAAGQSVLLMVNDGSAYTITWTDATFGTGGVVWETGGGTAPTLDTTGYTVIILWKVGTQVYGARVG